jgi:hypothetical protein
LLSEFEIQGSSVYYEKNHQTQMDYYKNGNGKAKYNHGSTSSVVTWWNSTRNPGDNRFFCTTENEVGGAGANHARTSLGVAPAFLT